jgi:hypothetical protein
MSIYLITYDLKSASKDYVDLYSKIKKIGEWQHPLESVWLVKSTTRDAWHIYEYLREEKDEKDLLMVVKVDLDDIQGWLPKSFWAWVHETVGRND